LAAGLQCFHKICIWIQRKVPRNGTGIGKGRVGWRDKAGREKGKGNVSGKGNVGQRDKGGERKNGRGEGGEEVSTPQHLTLYAPSTHASTDHQ